MYSLRCPRWRRLNFSNRNAQTLRLIVAASTGNTASPTTARVYSLGEQVEMKALWGMFTQK